MKDGLKMFLKIAIVLVAIVLALVIARAAHYYLYYTLPPKQVDISVNYSPNITCRTDTPLYMLITNDSRREIINTSFILSVKKGNSSNHFIRLLQKKYSTEKIIRAGDSYEGCWTFPKLNTEYYDPEELTYEVTHKIIVFSE